MATQQTINRHARAMFEPLTVVREYAHKKMVRHAEGAFTVAEDLFNGCFDGIGITVEAVLLCVQWTSGNTGAISYRKRKIEAQFAGPIADSTYSLPEWGKIKERFADRIIVQLWAWIDREGFRVFEWDWLIWGWTEKPFIYRKKGVKSA